MSERDKISEILKECAKLLANEGVEAMLVTAVKGKSAYRISNLSTDEEVKRFTEYVFSMRSSDATHSEVYQPAGNGELKFLGSVSDELN